VIVAISEPPIPAPAGETRGVRRCTEGHDDGGRERIPETDRGIICA
jgi:hypothetical protein